MGDSVYFTHKKGKPSSARFHFVNLFVFIVIVCFQCSFFSRTSSQQHFRMPSECGFLLFRQQTCILFRTLAVSFLFFRSLHFSFPLSSSILPRPKARSSALSSVRRSSGLVFFE